MTLWEEVQQHEYIYSFMYGRYYPPDDRIIEIKTTDLKPYCNREGFVYIWGFPGPEFNTYDRENYSSGWAYTKEELEEFINEYTV